MRHFTYVCSLLTKEDLWLEATTSPGNQEQFCTLANTFLPAPVLLFYDNQSS